MGEQVLAARILALREGSALTFASVGEATGPGQLSLDALRRVYRLGPRPTPPRKAVDEANASLRSDRRSHRAFPFTAHAQRCICGRGIDAVFVPFHVRDLRDFLDAVGPLGIAGFSVTLPHKETILRYLDECDPLAAEVGAVNTVAVRAGRLYGYNTDYVGVLGSIERRVPLASSRVLLFGAGGSARAAAFALARAGAVGGYVCAAPCASATLAKARAGGAGDRSRRAAPRSLSTPS